MGWPYKILEQMEFFFVEPGFCEECHIMLKNGVLYVLCERGPTTDDVLSSTMNVINAEISHCDFFLCGALPVDVEAEWPMLDVTERVRGGAEELVSSEPAVCL